MSETDENIGQVREHGRDDRVVDGRAVGGIGDLITEELAEATEEGSCHQR